jgi:hypothetical protein
MAYTPEQLSDLQCIRDAVMRYAHGLDRLDPEHMATAYWPDATDDHGPSGAGPATGYIATAMASHARWSPSIHTLLNHLVELEDDGVHARGETYCVAYLFDTERAAMYQWFGRYLDRFEKRGDEWRILERVVVHEAGQLHDPVVPMPFPTDQFKQATHDRGTPGRPIGPWRD